MRIRREVVPLALVLAAFAAGPMLSKHFLDLRYLLDSFSLQAEAGLLALGMTLVIVSGQIDLSVAANLALVSGVSARLMNGGMSTPLACLVGLALGAALGWLNGFLVARFKLPSFVVTLATMAAYRGVAHVMLGSGSERVPDSFVGIDMQTVPGIPVPLPLAILLLCALGVALVLHFTGFGRWIYAIGTNERASLFSGVPTRGVTAEVFAISGLFAGAAGLLMNSRLGVARFDNANGLELDVITAVVLGGASIYGGQGTVLGTLLALLTLALVRTEMGLANFPPEYQLAVVGTLLIVAVLLSNLLDALADKRRSAVKTSQ